MKLSELKKTLGSLNKLTFETHDGQKIPSHFHLTEMGMIQKTFIDCGGSLREEHIASFQLWSSTDIYHRLKPQKLLTIIESTEKKLQMTDLDVEVEFQKDTIGKYGLTFEEGKFILTATKTACLAEDSCGIPKPVVKLASTTQSCIPGSGCC